MDDDNFRLLKVLYFQNEKMNFRSIIVELNRLRHGTDTHPKTARAMLDRLIKRGLIKEEGRTSWKRGKRLWYSLTEKGKIKFMYEAMERVNEGLRVMKEFSDRLLAEKAKLEEWRTASLEAILNVPITEDMPLEERNSRVLAEEKRSFGLLTETYKNLHNLMIQVFLWKPGANFTPNPKKFFIGFTKYGGLYFIPAELLKEQEWSQELL